MPVPMPLTLTLVLLLLLSYCCCYSPQPTPHPEHTPVLKYLLAWPALPRESRWGFSQDREGLFSFFVLPSQIFSAGGVASAMRLEANEKEPTGSAPARCFVAMACASSVRRGRVAYVPTDSIATAAAAVRS
jgi:hypothetical protein